MRNQKQAARRCGNNERAKYVHNQRDVRIIACEYERWAHYAGIVIGVVFGIMFALGLIAG